jgi:hypothetical protein
MAVTTNIQVNGLITQLEGNTEKYVGRGSITAGGRCRELLSVTSVEGYSTSEQETCKEKSTYSKLHTYMEATDQPHIVVTLYL